MPGGDRPDGRARSVDRRGDVRGTGGARRTARAPRCGSGTTPATVGPPARRSRGARARRGRPRAHDDAEPRVPGRSRARRRDDAAPHPVADEDGRPRVLGAGPLRFVCLEPFLTGGSSSTAPAYATTVARPIAVRPAPSGYGAADRTRWREHCDRDPHGGAPVGAAHVRSRGHFVPGENRFEQLFTAIGTVTSTAPPSTSTVAACASTARAATAATTTTSSATAGSRRSSRAAARSASSTTPRGPMDR